MKADSIGLLHASQNGFQRQIQMQGVGDIRNEARENVEVPEPARHVRKDDRERDEGQQGCEGQGRGADGDLIDGEAQNRENRDPQELRDTGFDPLPRALFGDARQRTPQVAMQKLQPIFKFFFQTGFRFL
jgi:hypothetical protein